MQGTVITNKGLQLIAKLVASGTALSFTRAAVGIGSVPSGYDPTNMTNLNKYKMDGSIASCSSSGDTASIIFQISSIGVSAGFTITEAGLFATDPDEGEILYCYLDMSSDPQYIYAEGSAISKFVEMTLTVVVGSVQSITAYINPGSLLSNDGDISNTAIGTLDNITESFPVPAAKEKSSKFFGKIKKSLEDWKNLKASLLLVGSIVNNCVTNNAKLPLSAAQGKALMDLYTTLNSDLEYQYREGVSCLSLPPGRYTLANGLNCPVEGYYWFCDVISDPAGNYKTIEMHPYTGSNHNFYYYAKYSGDQWTGWEKYPDSSDLALVGNVDGMEFGTENEKRYFVFKHNDGSKSSLEFYNNGINLVRYDPKTTQWEIIWSIPVTIK